MMNLTMDFDATYDDDQIHFVGLLANVNSEILKLKLDRGFRTKQLPRAEGNDLLAKLERIPIDSIGFGSDAGILHLGLEDQFYVVENTFDGWATTAGENEEGVVLDPEYNDAQRVALYLAPTLRRLRFLTCKNVCMPLEYYYIIKNGAVRLKRKVWRPCIFDFHPNFSLNEVEMAELEKLTVKDIIPFRRRFLNLALNFFESSFETESKEQAFVSLVIALEIVLQPSAKAKGISLANNASNLIASNKLERQKIIDEITEIYRKRNRLVHEGIFSVKTGEGWQPTLLDEVLSQTRNYVKSVIVKAHELGKDKKQLSQFLHSFPDFVSAR